MQSLAKPANPLPLSLQREVDLAASSQWNLELMAGQMTPAATALLEAELDRLDAWLAPARPEEVMVQLGRLILHFPMTNMTQDEKTLLLQDYMADLAPYSAAIIHDACSAYRLNKENEFFPKVSALKTLADAKTYPLVRRQRVLHELLDLTRRPKPPEPPRLTGEEIDAMKRKHAPFLRLGEALKERV